MRANFAGIAPVAGRPPRFAASLRHGGGILQRVVIESVENLAFAMLIGHGPVQKYPVGHAAEQAVTPPQAMEPMHGPVDVGQHAAQKAPVAGLQIEIMHRVNERKHIINNDAGAFFAIVAGHENRAIAALFARRVQQEFTRNVLIAIGHAIHLKLDLAVAHPLILFAGGAIHGAVIGAELPGIGAHAPELIEFGVTGKKMSGMAKTGRGKPQPEGYPQRGLQMRKFQLHKAQAMPAEHRPALGAGAGMIAGDKSAPGLIGGDIAAGQAFAPADIHHHRPGSPDGQARIAIHFFAHVENEIRRGAAGQGMDDGLGATRAEAWTGMQKCLRLGHDGGIGMQRLMAEMLGQPEQGNAARASRRPAGAHQPGGMDFALQRIGQRPRREMNIRIHRRPGNSPVVAQHHRARPGVIVEFRIPPPRLGRPGTVIFNVGQIGIHARGMPLPGEVGRHPPASVAEDIAPAAAMPQRELA